MFIDFDKLERQVKHFDFGEPKEVEIITKTNNPTTVLIKSYLDDNVLSDFECFLTTALFYLTDSEDFDDLPRTGTYKSVDSEVKIIFS